MGVLNNLENANKKLAEFDMHVEIIIVGGAAFVLKNLINRATQDIDYINNVDQKIKVILEKYSINDRAKTHESNFGEWKNDLELVKELSNIKVMTISSERLLAARIFNRKRYTDLTESFKNKNIDIDQNKFEDILEELVQYNKPIYIEKFKDNRYLIDELYKERGWHETERIQRICKKFIS